MDEANPTEKLYRARGAFEGMAASHDNKLLQGLLEIGMGAENCR